MFRLMTKERKTLFRPHESVLFPNLEVRAHATLLHCSTTGGWCLQLASISRAVFQYGGVGKQRAHASSHTSNSTAISFSASFSATPTETGGASLITFPVNGSEARTGRAGGSGGGTSDGGRGQ